MHYLYRHFDGQGRLLYVGISLSAVNRLSQHRRHSAWFAAIKRVEVEAFPTKEEALLAERVAIVREGPLHNVQWSAVKGEGAGGGFPFSSLAAFSGLSLLQRKLANALLCHAHPDLAVKEEHEISVAHLSALIGYNSNCWAALREALNGLAATTLEWGMAEDLTDACEKSTLLAGAEIRNGMCHYAYSPFLREKLYSPEVYATINLDIQKKFGSKYALALYENCLRFVNTGSTGWITLEVFRQLLGCDEQALYQEFSRLNERVIKPAVQEVNETSDIEVTPEYKRQSRKVSSVRMTIKDKRDLPPLKSKKAKGKPAEEAARVQAMVDEATAREQEAKAKAAAEDALRQMKATLGRHA